MKSNKKKEKDDISVVKWKDNKERNETGVAGWEEGWGFFTEGQVCRAALKYDWRENVM